MNYQKELRTNTDKENRAIREKLALLKRISTNCITGKRLPNDNELVKANKLLDEIKKIETGRFEADNSSPLPGTAARDSWWNESQEAPEKTVITPIHSDSRSNSATGPVSEVTYRNLFGDPVRHDNGFSSFGEFLQVVASNRYDARLQTRDQTVGNPSGGGFLVSPEHAAGLFDLSISRSVFGKEFTVWPMASDTLKVPAFSDTDHSVDRAGLVSLWKAESAELDLDSINFRQLEFNARKLTILIKCSREFLEDAISAEKFVKAAMTKEIGWQIDHETLNTGTGAGQVLSILNAPATLSAEKAAGQAAQSFLWENCVEMAKLFNPGAPGRWVFSPSLRDQIFTMSLAVGTGGSGVFQTTSAVKEDGLSLLGFPVEFSEHCNVAGTKGDAFLMNPKAYALALRSDIRIESSQHVAFTSDQVVFKCTTRLDGMPIADAPLTLADGSSQVSDFVTLDTRA